LGKLASLFRGRAVEGRPTDEKLEPVLSRRKDLASLRWHLCHDEGEDPEQAEELDRFISKVLCADEEVKSASKEIWQLTRFDREQRVRSLKQVRDDLSEMVFDDFSDRWMRRTRSTVDYWLEVALDLEGVLYSFPHPAFEAEGLIQGSILKPRTAAAVRAFGTFFYLVAGIVLLYVTFRTSYSWIGGILLACLGWLIYRRAQRVNELERGVRRWRGRLSLVETCVHEIASGSFDPPEIGRRLTEQESNGLFVRSTIFTMLRRSAALRGAEDLGAVPGEKASKPTQEEKEHWAFQRASTLTLSELRAMKPGEILRLIERSWFYPSEKAAFERFEYKHDRVSEENSSEFGYEIHGFRRFSGTEDWGPYQFLASEKESSTSSCAGTIKRLD
jgi:hypothetical protein